MGSQAPQPSGVKRGERVRGQEFACILIKSILVSKGQGIPDLQKSLVVGAGGGLGPSPGGQKGCRLDEQREKNHLWGEGAVMPNGCTSLGGPEAEGGHPQTRREGPGLGPLVGVGQGAEEEQPLDVARGQAGERRRGADPCRKTIRWDTFQN